MTPQKNMSMKWVWQNTECNLQTCIQISIDGALHNVPVNYKTTHPPGQSPGIWPALSSVQWGIWPKTRPARWGIWLSCQNVCQRSETKGLRNSLLLYKACEPHSQVIALVDSTWVFQLLSFYIVISWNMPLFKVWNEDKLNKKFVVAENFVCIKGRA